MYSIEYKLEWDCCLCDTNIYSAIKINKDSHQDYDICGSRKSAINSLHKQ